MGKKGLSKDLEPKEFMCLVDKGKDMGKQSGDHLVCAKTRTRGSVEIPCGGIGGNDAGIEG